MGSPVEDAKNAIWQNAAQAKHAVNSAKNASMSDIYSSVNSENDVLDAVISNSQYTNNKTGNLIGKEGNVLIYDDGTYGVETSTGNVINGLDQLSARTFGARNEGENRALLDNAPTDNIGTRARGFARTIVDLGVTGASALGGIQTFEGVVEGNNYGRIRARPTAEDIEKFKAIQKDVNLAEFSPDVAASSFSNPEVFKNLENDYKEFNANKSRVDAIQAFGKNVKSPIPINSTDQQVSQVAFKTIAKNDGVLSAAWNAAVNDMGTMAAAGVDSIPYMIAFTAGGPLTQAGVLATLAVGKGNQAIAEFREKEGRDPTVEESDRIRIWSAASTVAEKFGDWAAVKAIPVAKFQWAQKVAAKAAEGLPGKFARTLTGKVLINGVLRPAEALSGEGLSGAATSISDQMAAKGKVSDWDQVAYDALAEAMGTPGGIGGMVVGNAALQTAKAAFRAPGAIKGNMAAQDQAATLSATINDVNTSPEDKAAAQAAYDALPDNVKPSAPPPVAAPPVPTAAPVDNTAMNDADLDAALADITLDPADPVKASSAILALKSRALTPEQEVRRKERAKALKAEFDASQDNAPVAEKPLGIINIDATDAELTAAEATATEAPDVAYITALREAKVLREALAPADAEIEKSIMEVDQEALNGSSDRWTGMNTYLNDMNTAADEAASGKTIPTLAAQRIKTALGNLQVHVANMQAKSAALSAAIETARTTGKSVFIQGKRVNPGKDASREMSYTPVEMTETEFTEARNKNQYVLRIDANSENLVGAVNSEAAYGTKILEVAKAHKDTSFAKAKFTTAQSKTKAAKDLTTAVESTAVDPVDPVTDADLAALNNLEPGTNASPQTSETAATDAKPDSAAPLATPKSDTAPAPQESAPAEPKTSPKADTPVSTPAEPGKDATEAPKSDELPAEPAPQAETQITVEYGSKNKLVTTEQANKAAALLNKAAKGGQFNMGLDPALLKAGVDLAVYHIEAGASKFADYLVKMSKAIEAEGAKAYFQHFYEEARKIVNNATEMTPSWPWAANSEEEFLSTDDVVKEDKYLVAGKDGYANTEQREAIDKIGAWMDDPKPANLNFVLEGRGGTGKTTILAKIIESSKLIKKNRVAYTATTNKAKTVLDAALKDGSLTVSTIWTALGIVPSDEKTVTDSSADSGITNVKEEVLAGIDLLVIDEASMLGEAILQEIIKAIGDRPIKVLFMGDSAQLPPIRSSRLDKKAAESYEFGGQDNSPVFIENSTGPYTNRAKLLKPQRQNAGSPILALLSKFTTVLDDPKLLSVKNKRGQLLITSDARKNVFSPERNAGVIFENSRVEFLSSFINDYKNNSLGTRIITAYNEKTKNITVPYSVAELNRAIFAALHPDRVYGEHAVGDILMSYNTVTMSEEQKIWNSSEYQITETGPVEYRVWEGMRIPYQRVTMQETISKEEISVDLPAIPDGYQFPGNASTLEEAVRNAFSAKKSSLSVTAYEEFKKTNSAKDIAKLANIEMHPAFAITAWKAQGSTYRNIYIAENSLNSMIKWKQMDSPTKNHYQAMYVALSRPTDKLVMHSSSLNNDSGIIDGDAIDYTAQERNVKPPVADEETQRLRDIRRTTLARNEVLRKQRRLLEELTQDPMEQDTSWQSKEVTVYNDDGSVSTVTAKERWDELSKELKMVEDLIKCVKA